MSSSSVLSRAANGVSALFFGNIVQRLVTFSMRTALLAHVTSADVGLASVRFELLRSVVLFTSREAARLVALRAPLDILSPHVPAAARAHLANLAWLPVPIGLLLTACLWVWGGSRSHEMPHAQIAFLLYCAATAIETIAEPAHIYCDALLLSSQRGVTEAMGALAEGAVTYMAARAGWGAASFGAGAVCRAAVLALGLWVAVLRESRLQDKNASWRMLLPRAQPLPPVLDVFAFPRAFVEAQLGIPQVSLLIAFTANGVVKHMLTEGDKLALSATASLSASGEYSVANSYGSLVLRILFAPLEEALRGAVSKLVDSGLSAPPTTVPRAAKHALRRSPSLSPRSRSPGKSSRERPRARSPKTGTAVSKLRRSSTPIPTSRSSTRTAQESDPLDRMVNIFVGVLRAVLLLGILSAGLGSAFAPLFARFILPRAAAKGNIPSLLSAYAIAVPFFAINGVSEAFATGAAGPARVREASMHLTCTAVLGALAVAFLVPHYGAHALVAVNVLTLTLRATSALRFTAKLLFFRGLGGLGRLSQALPRFYTATWLLSITIAAHVVVAISPANSMRQAAAQGCAAIALGFIAISSVWLLEGQLLRATARELRGQFTDR
jgi:oligosaccharide translocation protein RFT1